MSTSCPKSPPMRWRLPSARHTTSFAAGKVVALVETDIESEGLNRVVIAACSQRVFPELFDFGGNVLTDRVNLREQVAWCHTPNDEDTQMLGEDHIRMGVARVAAVEPPTALIEETSKDLMVIGGGISGMTAAKSAAAAGYKVTLVEKEDRLGGWATRFSKVFPKHPPYKDLEDSGCDKLIQEVEADPNITIHKSTTVKKTSGQPGQFAVELQNGGNGTEITVGSIIQASGWKPYEAEKLTHLGYGSSPDVITNIQMEEMVSNGGIKRPSDGKPVGQRRLPPVRRLARPGPSAVLLLRVLPGFPETGVVRPGAVSGRQGLHHLQGHQVSGPVRTILRQRSGRRWHLPHQG